MSRAMRLVTRHLVVQGDSGFERAQKELQLRFLKPDMLMNDDDVQESLSAIEDALSSRGVDTVLDACLGQPNSVEFLLSAISAKVYERISRHVLDHFPRTQQDFTPTSLSWRLLARLSKTAFFLPHDPDTSLPSYTQDLQLVQNASLVLEALSLFNPGSATPLSPGFGEEDLPFAAKKGTQRARKQSRKANRASKIVDTAAFRNMGLDVPQSQEEAEEIAKDVLRESKIILQNMLDFFTEPALAPVLKTNYIPYNTPAEFSFDPQNEGNSLRDEGNVTMQNVPPAFPHVQPMKAALYFDSAEGFGDWHIYISGRAKADLREAKRKDGNTFRIYIKKIKELSKGHFSGDNQKRLTGPGTPIPIFEAKMTRDSRLVYQVDCISEFDSKVERQVVRVFGIYTHAQLDKRLWDSMGHQLSRKGKEYEKRCLFRAEPYNKGDNAVPPGVWPQASHDIEGSVAPLADTRKEDLEELHSLLVLEKFHILSQALLSSILADQDTAHVFQVSPHEQEIIEHDHSCYVLGRSGTGKTTTMLFKMLGLENSWKQALEPGSARPRQLFVTQSRVLADKVEEYFIKLLESLHMAAHSEGDIVELLTRKKNREEAGLVDRDEAVDWREDLPKRFSDLDDGHFPMFITYDKLSALLEADMDQDSSKPLEPESSPTTGPILSPTTTSDYMLQKRPSFVSYDIFRDEYWPHFPQNLTKGLDPALVFSEFMGVIKGSEQTLSLSQPFLDRDTYVGLSVRTQATFASRRKEIYALFEAYLKMRRERRDYDAADRTHAILREMRERGVKGKKLDFLYVDEVQDNLLIDAKVLRFICWNPEGLFWAGDTAQTISVGSSFRFNDLKAFLHRLEESIAPQIQSKTTRQPRTFQLATNYRSHGGIVQCAHSVIRLITQFWPNAIDILAEERGIVDGIKPVFFSGWDSENVRYESFLFGEAGSHIEFGAQQCILVRNDSARDQLREQVGDIGLILTLYESKGLEFNDVLLFNFFEDSSVDVSQWRVVLNALDRSQREGVPAPSFDETRHVGVCTELKFLYVAVTRARKNLWIVDKSDKGGPMKTFWTAQGLVHHHTPGSDTELPKLAVASTPEEWGVMARTLFDNKRYFQAMHSYERAEMPRERAVAHAYYRREQARSTTSGPRAADPRKRAFIEAAEAFVGCANEATREKNEYFRVAAELFVSVGEYGRAGEAYLAGARYNDAAKNFRKAGLFEKTVSVLRTHWDKMDEAVALPLRDVSRLYFFKQNDIKTAASLFNTLEEKLEFVEDYDLDVARVEILVEEGRYGEAADLHLQECRTMQAIRLYLQDYQTGLTRKSLIEAKNCILRSLWKHLSFAIVIDSPNKSLQASLAQLFRYVKQVDVDHLEEKERLEVQMFIAIEQGDVQSLRKLGVALSQINNKPAALLCLDHAFRNTQDLLVGTGEQVTLVLKDYYIYTALLREFIGLKDPWSRGSVQKLFNIESPEDSQIHFRRGTFMFSSYEYRTRKSLGEDYIALHHIQAQNLLEFALTERLRQSIEIVNEQALYVTVMEPCQMYATTQTCNRGRECPREHNMDKTWFNRRLRFYFILGLILQVHDSLPAWSHGPQGRNRIRIWFERVSEALFPMHHAFGSTTILNTTQIPEAKRGLGFLRDVVANMLYTLDPYEPKFAFVSTLLRSLSLGYLVDKEAIRNYINDTKVVSDYRPPHLLRSLGSTGATRYVVHELVEFFQGTERTSLIAGVLFFKHILDNRIYVDILALCAFMDILSSSCIFAKRLRSGFHGLTLPRSWILARLNNLDGLRDKDIPRFLSTFVDPIRELLLQLHTGVGAEHLLYRGRPINDAAPRVREMAIARICRCICLFGYNMNWRETQSSTFYSVTSLRRGQTVLPAAYSPYVMADDWSRLGRVATTSLTKTPLDEVILLTLSGGRPVGFNSPHVRRVTYKTLAEIPFLLKADGVIESKLRVEAAPFVPSARPTTEAPSGTTDAAHSADPNESLVEEKDDDPEETKPEDVEAIIQSMASGATPSLSAEVVAARKKVALALLTSYRRTVRYRNSVPVAGLPTYRAKSYELCLEESQKISWTTTSIYRFVFLGPLPHVLACLEAMLAKVAKDKKEAKVRMKKAQHDDLEKVMQEQTKISGLSKKLHELQKTLEPSSQFHRDRDLKALKQRVVRVLELALEVEMDGQLDADMAIAYRGIVQERVKEPKQKPVLNVDDLDE